MAKRYRKTSSGLILPNDGDIAGGRDRRYIDSRRFTHRRSCRTDCCKPGCVIFSDNFAADNLASGWTQRAGAWSVASGKLATSSSNALITANTAFPGGSFSDHVVQVKLTAQAGNRDRIVFNYDAVAQTYSFVEFHWDDLTTVCHVTLQTSGGTTVVSRNLPFAYASGAGYIFRVCVKQDSVTVSYVATLTSAPLRNYGILYADLSSAKTTSGVATGALAAPTSFDDFSLQRIKGTDDTCLACVPPCPAECSGTLHRVAVTFEGIQEYPNYGGSCTRAACLQYNQTFICEWFWSYTGYPYATSGTCLYGFEWDTPLCNEIKTLVAAFGYGTGYPMVMLYREPIAYLVSSIQTRGALDVSVVAWWRYAPIGFEYPTNCADIDFLCTDAQGWAPNSAECWWAGWNPTILPRTTARLRAA